MITYDVEDDVEVESGVVVGLVIPESDVVLVGPTDVDTQEPKESVKRHLKGREGEIS